MMKIKPLFILCLATFLLISLPACKKKGPIEKVGESIDNAAEEVKDAVTDKGPAEKVGESIDNAVDKAKGE